MVKIKNDKLKKYKTLDLSNDSKLELERLDNELLQEVERLGENLKIFHNKKNDIIIDLLSQLSKLPDKLTLFAVVTKIFDITIGQTIKNLSKDIYEELKKQDDLIIFDDYFILKIIQFLERILEFEKKLDEQYPKMSQYIIMALSSLLVGLISTYVPIIGVLIKTTGVLDKLKDFLSANNLTQTIQMLNEKVNKVNNKIIEVKNNESLKDIYITGEHIATLSKEAKVPVISIVQLNLKSETLEKVYNVVKDNYNGQRFLQEVVKALDLMPSNRKEVEQKLEDIKESITNLFYENNLSELLQKSLDTLNNKVDLAITNTREALISTFDPDKNFCEKLSFYDKAAGTILELTKEVQKTVNLVPGGQKLTKTLSKKIETIVKGNIPMVASQPLFVLAKSVPSISGIFGFTKSMNLLINTKNAMKITNQLSR